MGSDAARHGLVIGREAFVIQPETFAIRPDCFVTRPDCFVNGRKAWNGAELRLARLCARSEAAAGRSGPPDEAAATN